MCVYYSANASTVCDGMGWMSLDGDEKLERARRVSDQRKAVMKIQPLAVRVQTLSLSRCFVCLNGRRAHRNRFVD